MIDCNRASGMRYTPVYRMPPNKALVNRLVIPDKDFVVRIQYALDQCGMKSGEVRISSLTVGYEACGVVEMVGGRTLVDDYRKWIGFVNSNVGRRSTVLYGGISDKHNTFGAVLSKLSTVQRRDGMDGFREAIDDGVAKFTMDYQLYGKKISAMRKMPICRERADALLLPLAREKLIPWKRLGQLDDLWRDDKTQTRWDLIEHFGRAVRWSPVITTAPITDQISTMFKFYAMVEVMA